MRGLGSKETKGRSSAGSAVRGAEPAAGGGKTTGDVAVLLQQERERTCELLAEWADVHRKALEVQAAQQERILQALLGTHRSTLEALSGKPGSEEAGREAPQDRLKAPSPLDSPRDESASSSAISRAHTKEEGVPLLSTATPREAPAPPQDRGGEGGASSWGISVACARLGKGSELLEWWKRTSGMHTVDKWVRDYMKHPAGWGALLMIHGIPEITGRLRSKVENYAIYSALFLSVSIGLLADIPDAVGDVTCPHTDYSDWEWWFCVGRKRAYMYCLAIGVAEHMLCILLAMAFVNALNEAPRDADVYRMFSRGQGFVATVKCQWAFRIGAIADYMAIIIATSYHIGWESVIGAAILIAVCTKMFTETSSKLFNSASIVRYWREDLGGKPDSDDPYDLDVPCGMFSELAELNRTFLLNPTDGAKKTPLEVWRKLQEGMVEGEQKAEHEEKGQPESKNVGTSTKSAAVAALF